MSMLKNLVVVLLAAVLAAAPVAAQTPTPAPAPGSIEEARQRAREEAQRAREAAERAREAARRVREQESELRRSNRGGTRGPDRNDRGPEFTETFSRTVRIGRNGTFELGNVAGDITVTGGGGDDVRIDAVKRVRQQSEADARAIMREMEIRVTERSNQVEVRTEYPQRRRNWSGSVDYTITLPASATVTLHSVSGDLRVTNVRGDLRADTVSGDVTASGIGRLRSVRTVSGDLMLTDVEGEDVSAGTVSGDATLRSLKVGGLTLEAVSGSLRFTDVEVARADFRTISGDIDFTGRLARNGRYRFQSQSGDIRLAPANDAGFDLEATSFSGAVRSDYTFRSGGTVESPERGPRTQSIRGTVGDASAVITLRSFSGNVTVLRR